LLVKTRTNFFPKYLQEEDLLIIQKNEQSLKVKMDEQMYTLLLDIFAEYASGKVLDLHNRTVEYKKGLKFAVTQGLVDQRDPSGTLSDYLYHYLENSFDQYKEVVRDISSTHVNLLNFPDEYTGFFHENGLVNPGAPRSQNVIWLEENDRPNGVEGDICILHINQNYALFHWRDQQDVELAKSLLRNKITQTNGFILGKEILPMKILMKMLNGTETDNTITLLYENGRDETISTRGIADTFKHYERTFHDHPEIQNEPIDFIQKVESKLLQWNLLPIHINQQDRDLPVSLNVSPYEISFGNRFRYRVFDYDYKKAAVHALTNGIEAFLQDEDPGEGKWVSAATRELFYIKGLSAFHKEEVDYYQLESLPRDICKKINYNLGLTERISEIKVVANYIFSRDVFCLYLLNEQNQVLYKSDPSVVLKEEILRGLAKITGFLINDKKFPNEYLNQPLVPMQYPSSIRGQAAIFEDLAEASKEMEIYEQPWIHQPEFETQGLYIGKFYRNGVK
jgi:hypothetical protein